MKTTQTLQPKLRFPEFEGDEDWETFSVDELLKSIPTRDHQVQSSQIKDTGLHPVVDQGKELTAGHSDNTELLFQNLPIIVFGDHTTILKFIDFEFIVGADGTKILQKKHKEDLLQYLYYAVDHCKIEQEGYKRHYSILREIKIPKPAPPEQQKIADCLGSLDELLTAHRCKLAALQDHKKGLLQQLFPTEGQTTPNLRFPEFEGAGEWLDSSIQGLIEKKYIISHLDGNHGALYPRSDEFAKKGVPYITANDFKNGSVDFSNCKFLPEPRALKFKKGVAKDGDILFAHNATVGPVAKLTTDLEFVILSTTATYYRCDQDLLINDFLLGALNSPSFVAQYTRVMAQSTRNQVPITAQRKFHLQLPSPREQQKIANCLSDLDALITAETESIESLQTHKKGLMQNLFPNPDLK